MRLAKIFPLYLILTASPAIGNPSSWGSDITLKTATTLTEAIKTYDSTKGDILVDGIAEQVCQKKGCWLTLASEDKEVRVTFQGYKFFVPFSLKGEKVRVQGRLAQESISVKDQKHFLQDEGRAQAEIDAVTQPKIIFTMVATGVRKL